jgi:ABC-2 type transport system ATP-binding protein
MIRTENLTKTYGRTNALSDLTFNVPEGSVFALAGANGAGKSSAIRILMNLIQPSSGHAEMFGVDSTKLGSAQFSSIGYFSEDQNLPTWMSVAYFLKHCRALYPTWDDALAADLVSRFQLPTERRLSSLSRGMRVKAALTASLAYRPRLIVLDEPFSGLDLLVREQLIESLVDCTPEATILLASHDLAEIETFATHVGYLNDGRLEFVEEMSSLSARFRDIEVTLDQPSATESVPSTWLNPQQSGAVVRFIDSRYDADRSNGEIAQHFNGVHDIQPRAMSLRSIFLALARSRKSQCA